MSSTVLRDEPTGDGVASPAAVSPVAITAPGVWISLAVVTVFGLVLRLLPTLGTALPLNDGGLFATMASDLQAAGFALPETTSYNLDSIPFAYPPLGIYLLALLSSALGVEPTDVLHVLPAFFATATIPLAYLIGARLLRSELLGLVAALAFALLPRSYEWLIVGGGVTRAPGLILAMLAVWLFLRALESGSVRSSSWRESRSACAG